MTRTEPSNEKIATVLERIADLLETQDANPFRVRAYRDAASSVREVEAPVARWVQEGDGEALQEIPGVGESIAGLIVQFVHTGRSGLLERLQGEVSPERLFTQVPGIGEVLAGRIVDELGAHSLEELERAAHDGRLERVQGFGPERIRAVRVSLAGMLSRAAQRRIQSGGSEGEAGRPRPAVGLLLDVDAAYRRRAEAGELHKIAPRRFNPEGEAWLPIMHTERDDWRFTALYSNTARAHELDKTHDWVVIYYERDGREDQATVVTETRGPLEGERVVRGREAECRRYYQSKD